jgi:hypothetical protein
MNRCIVTATGKSAMSGPEAFLSRRSLIGGVAGVAALASAQAIGEKAPRRTFQKPGTASAGGQVLMRDEFRPISGWKRHGVILRQDLPWESSLMQDPCLIYDVQPGPLFKMWYGSLTNIGYATSADGYTWAKHPEPVIQQTLPSESKALNQPSVVFHDGNWHMTYFGVDASGLGQIHYACATSPQGPWIKTGVVLTATEPWEDRYIYNSSLLFDTDERRWKIWYTAGKIASAGGEPRYICYATAARPQGPWAKFPGNPILRPMDDGGWASFGIGGPNVRKLGPKLYEIRLIGWQADYPSRGGRLLSHDGVTWSLDRSAMDLDLGVVGGPEDSMIYRQFVVDHRGRPFCFYNAKNNRPGWNETINLATWEDDLSIVDPARWAMLQGDGIPDGGSFEVRAGALHTLGNAGQRPQTLQGNHRIDCRDYGVRVLATPRSDGQADKENVLLLRYTDRQNYYYAGIGAGGHKYVIGLVEKGHDRILVSEGTIGDLGTGSAHQLCFQAVGSRLQLFDGDRVVLAVSDPTLTPETSYVGIQTSRGDGKASFAQLEVFAL